MIRVIIADMTMNVSDIGVGTIRSGVIGAGFMARVHTQAVRAAAGEVATIAASSLDRAVEAAHALGVAHAEASAADLIGSDVDLVHVCSPNATHAQYAADALRAGHHVVCEKPLATSVADAGALVALAGAVGRVHAVPFVYRYHPMVREARARIAAGELGTLLTIDGSYLQDWMLAKSDENWRAGAAGGPSRAFADIGSHLCDLIEFVSGERIVRLAARTRRVFDERAGVQVANEDIAAVLAETATGVLVTLLVSQMAPGRKNALVIELHGTEQSARFAQENPEQLWLGARAQSTILVRDPDTASAASARMQSVPAGHPMGYQDAFNAFMSDVHAAIRGDAPDGLPTFHDGLRAAVITDAVLRAAATGTWVEVDA